jgi:hypothetical protein
MAADVLVPDNRPSCLQLFFALRLEMACRIEPFKEPKFQLSIYMQTRQTGRVVSRSGAFISSIERANQRGLRVPCLELANVERGQFA